MKIFKSITALVRGTIEEFRHSADVLYKAFFPDVTWQPELIRDDYKMEPSGVIRRKN